MSNASHHSGFWTGFQLHKRHRPLTDDQYRQQERKTNAHPTQCIDTNPDIHDFVIGLRQGYRLHRILIISFWLILIVGAVVYRWYRDFGSQLG